MKDSVWVVTDLHSGELICGFYSFNEMIEYLCFYKYIDEGTAFITKDKEVKSLQEVFGDKWIDDLKSFSSKKINHRIFSGLIITQVTIIDIPTKL